MRNKHLVLLFFAVLAAGLLARRLPWFKANIFQTDLVAVDTSAVTQISIFQPDQPELLLERTEAGWAAAQELRSVAVQPEQIAPLLDVLFAVRSLRIVKTTQPDTLGFSGKNRLQVVVFQDKKIVEQFEIGNETLENGQPATFIHLNRHEGIYLVQNHLRGIFSKKLDDFRDKKVAVFDPMSVKKIVLAWPEDGLEVQFPIFKNDSSGRWEPLGQAPPEIAGDTIQAWLRLFARLEGSPFADNFDESRARKTLLSRVELYPESSDSLIFRIFYVRPPDLPEEIAFAKARHLPVYVLHSSQNPSNFFAPQDTTLLRRICFGLLPFDPGAPNAANVPKVE